MPFTIQLSASATLLHMYIYIHIDGDIFRHMFVELVT